MTIDKREVITIPKWIIMVLTPMVVSAVGSFVAISVQSAKYETEIAQLKEESENKINKAEAELQFQFIKEQLKAINLKLDKSDLKLDRNNQ
jgi:hypothetical protein